LQTIVELLAVIERLPEPRQAEARARVAAALDAPAPTARAELGVLALDLLDVIDLTEASLDARPA
jgi:hypothetical protein